MIEKSNQDGVLELRLSFNESNAFTSEAFEALFQSLEEHASDETLRALVLTSSRTGFFSNGLSPDAVHGRAESDVRALIGRFFDVLDRLFYFPTPTVCAINGHAIGYGAMLALVSDYRFMVERGARVSYPEVNLGIGLPVFVSSLLVELVGITNARDLLLTGRALKSPEAVSMGLVDEALPEDSLLEKARSHAKKIGSGSRTAIRAIKANLKHAHRLNRETILAKDRADTLALLQSADAKEGFQALIEKRRPRFA
ncbi:MAG: enoyl-CoA hydratase/isomerase family protein [Spirochaetales bacterium]|nr:enoyl-CoA hydratase/isomerase family protein [Leptospiraceae bacterium]MCP5482846.1 enoyl-CoA hydratase/isomerase family protein [Spirochaetales bacterium]